MLAPVDPREQDRLYRVCLSLSLASFLAWVVNSYALSNVIRSISRLGGKLLTR